MNDRGIPPFLWNRETRNMSNDAKLGLFLGVALVILIAVVFFRRDASQTKSPESASAAVKPGAVRAPGPRQRTQRANNHASADGDTLPPASPTSPQVPPSP
jgi:hypothetical protein